MSSTRLKASRSADRSMSWALFPLLMPMFLRRSPMHTRGKSRRASIASCDETLDPCLHVSIASGSRTTPCLSCPIFSVLGSLHAALKFDDHWVQNRISEEQAASLVHSCIFELALGSGMQVIDWFHLPRLIQNGTYPEDHQPRLQSNQPTNQTLLNCFDLLEETSSSWFVKKKARVSQLDSHKQLERRLNLLGLFFCIQLDCSQDQVAVSGKPRVEWFWVNGMIPQVSETMVKALLFCLETPWIRHWYQSSQPFSAHLRQTQDQYLWSCCQLVLSNMGLSW